MTIELITGTPGSGKTCYAVSQRIASECNRSVVYEDSMGQLATVTRRVVVAGIKGLSLPHERLPHPLTGEKVSQVDLDRWNAVDSEGEPVHKRLPYSDPVECEASFYNWWLWCKPGDLIVIDEIQFIMARGTLNKKAPPYLNLMAMHRHYGIDFLFITQHPDFLDPFVRKLVSMHRHVRSIMGMSLCMVYEWDHASNPERYSQAVKSKYLRRAAHFKLYKSSVSHIKPPTSGRGIFVVLPLLVVGGAALAYTFKTNSVLGSGGMPAKDKSRSEFQAPNTAAQLKTSYQADRPAGWKDAPKITGCYAYRDKCECIGETGRKVQIQYAMCKISSAGDGGLVQWESRPEPPLQAAPRVALPTTSNTPPLL